MTERKLDEIEKLEGIGDIGEVPEDGFKVEEVEDDCFCEFEPEEIIEEVETDNLEEVDEEYFPEQSDEELEENKATQEDK